MATLTYGGNAYGGFLATYGSGEADGQVLGVTLNNLGGCSGSRQDLPGIELRWSQVVPAAGEVFAAYEVWRQNDLETPVRIAVIANIATRRFVDYEVTSRASYIYSLVWTGTAGGGAPIASLGTRNVGWLAFDHCWIHDRADPTKFVRYDQLEASIQVHQAQDFLQAAGRMAPTMYVGTQESRRVRVPGLDYHYTVNAGEREMLRTLYSRQRTNASVLVARFGAARETLYCNISSPFTDNLSQKSSSPSIELIETHVTVEV